MGLLMKVMLATTLDWVKSLKADIRGDCGKLEFKGSRGFGKMVMQIDRNDGTTGLLF